MYITLTPSGKYLTGLAALRYYCRGIVTLCGVHTQQLQCVCFLPFLPSCLPSFLPFFFPSNSILSNEHLSTSSLPCNCAGPFGAFLGQTLHYILHLPVICRKTLACQAFPEFQRMSLTRDIRKCRNKENQSKAEIIVQYIIQGQGPLVPPQGLQIIFQVKSLSCFADTEIPGAHKYIDPRLVGTRRLVRLTPDYLTTSQSEECPQIDHTLCSSFPYPVFENLSLKAIGEFEFFEHQLPGLLAWHLQ